VGPEVINLYRQATNNVSQYYYWSLQRAGYGSPEKDMGRRGDKRSIIMRWNVLPPKLGQLPFQRIGYSVESLPVKSISAKSIRIVIAQDDNKGKVQIKSKDQFLANNDGLKQSFRNMIVRVIFKSFHRGLKCVITQFEMVINLF